jgi:RNA polymerase sigma-70 factor (ECF subfamily)
VKPPPTPAVAVFPVDRTGDAQLVEAAARGDRGAMAEVWDRYSDFVRRVLHGALGRDGAIEDLTQEVFLAFVRGAKTVSDGAKLRGFLAGIAVRLAAMEIRRRRVRRWLTLSPTGELPESPAPQRDRDGQEVLAALDRVLLRLSQRRRMAFMLRHVQQLEMSEVAAALSISESTLRRELQRAREHVRRGAAREPALAEYLARRAVAGGGGGNDG